MGLFSPTLVFYADPTDYTGIHLEGHGTRRSNKKFKTLQNMYVQEEEKKRFSYNVKTLFLFVAWTL